MMHDTATNDQPLGATQPQRAQHSSNGVGMRARGKTLAQVILIVILLLNGVWITGFWLLNQQVAAPRVQRDLAQHIANINALLRQPDLTSSTTLNRLETEFQATTTDLQQLDSLLPLGGEWPFGATPTEHHLLQMAMDTTQAVQNIISAVPYLQTVATSATQSLLDAGASPGATGDHAPLTLHTISLGQFYLDTARQFWQEAQQQRALLTPALVASLHDAQASVFMAQYDQFAPTLSTDLELTSSLLDWSPGALGVTTPDHFLLLVMDSSDLRAGGGRVWDYADLKTVGGGLVSGIQLHSAQSLDCPQGACGSRPIPTNYAWFPLNRTQFGLTDAVLDPSLPNAAGTIETIYQLEAGEQVDGVITLTPALFADLLRVTGPISVPSLDTQVTAANVQSLLASEHETVAATTSAQRDAASDLETLLTRAILAQLADANVHKQDAFRSALAAAFQARDVSVYGNSPRVEAMLTLLGMGGALTPTQSDSLLVSDTNDGPTAINPLVSESYSDVVTLDAKGDARHALSVTYTYHTDGEWSGTLPLQPYKDFVRVIAPQGASVPRFSGSCAAARAAQAGYTAAGCQFTLSPGGVTVIHAAWTVPASVASSGGRYTLAIQRQPGADDTVTVRLNAPTGDTIADLQTSDGITVQASAVMLVGTARPLTRDVQISATLSRGQG